MTCKLPKSPLIAIIGATGTGKSQLAVELAKRHNGEIINGDAMQLYAGLPIITNKITVEEQEGIPHHLLGCIGLSEPTWVVGSFVKRAARVLEEIRARGKLPILVGGTHYYTQSLLFHDRLAEEDDTRLESSEAEEPTDPFLEQPTEVLLEELQKVDPVMAARWHPKDRRKIQRSLEIYLKTGRKASDVYAEQQTRKLDNHIDEHDDENTSQAMRYNALLIWIHAETNTLRARLDTRVEKMLASGLLAEVHTLHSHAGTETAAARPPDESRGIWVSIGYKEFKPYFSALQAGTSSPEALRKSKEYGLERTQIATRQYAKRQVRWIRIKLLSSLLSSNNLDSLYLLNGTNPSTFQTDVVDPAADLVARFLAAETLPAPASLGSMAREMLQPKREYDLASKPELWSKEHCEVCGVTCVVQEQWEQHVRSKGHKKALSKQRQRGMDSSQAVNGA
ncbi:hypothetical protein LTR62_000228 [Meristemomyces frigidus]|uniref:tRNA dimethylallyltransferase n=1 Tax=Meristemomyces frigidus TaxID=1508187 RepID=A0AAN7YL48_9PEZI|nr:hypothetical protein LTR62_000228 [Meristemomyces frigidus]